MGLSTDLISQFVKVTNDDTKSNKKETIVYATTVERDGRIYVQIDGSEMLTPVSTTAAVEPGERVTVMIKNHSAVITGNISSPSASNLELEGLRESFDSADIANVANKIDEFEILVADKVSTGDFSAEVARIDQLRAEDVIIKESLTAATGNIEILQAEMLTVTEQITARDGAIENLQTQKLDTVIAEATYATINELDAMDVRIYRLEATYGEFEVMVTDRFSAVDADIADLTANKLSTTEAAITYANIDFSNIGKAAMEYFYSNSGLIENVVVEDGTITGNLVGVTIIGDNIAGNTIRADKLVIKGEDGLYYKLNTDGVTLDEEQTDENSLNGSIICAKSITASKINVSDLVAFDATIGGFTISDYAIYSDVKDSGNNVTRGVYLGSDGEFNIGDSENFIKYYRDDNTGDFKLAISASSIMYALSGKHYSIEDLGRIGEYVHISTYEDEPCIELGEADSDFKLRITNTRMIFTEGASVLAYFNNQSFHVKKAVVEEELQQGGFVWKARSNGNLGLVWKGGTS
jgi:hypothetical protein